MDRNVRFVASRALVAAALSLFGCTRPAGTQAATGTDVVLECTAGDIHHVFRIHPSGRTVDDVSLSPAKSGVADVTPAEYRLLFQEERDHYELMVQINRSTGAGTRRLFDDEQQPIKGHGGTDGIICQERGAP